MSKILIIEDDIFLGDVLVEKLGAAGYAVTLARDGTSGLKKMREGAPDLVLLDIILPQMNGYEVLEKKRSDKSIAAIPVVVISNSGQPVEINRALALGVKDYLVKAQFDPDEVLVKVRQQLGGGATVPAAARAAGAGTAAAGNAEEKGTLRGKTIMWVEDDKFLSDIIARKLAFHGATLQSAADGETALKLLEKEKPELILLDILLPGIDGFEILRRLKANKETKGIPVILLSNLGQ